MKDDVMHIRVTTQMKLDMAKRAAKEKESMSAITIRLWQQHLAKDGNEYDRAVEARVWAKVMEKLDEMSVK